MKHLQKTSVPRAPLIIITDPRPHQNSSPGVHHNLHPSTAPTPNRQQGSAVPARMLHVLQIGDEVRDATKTAPEAEAESPQAKKIRVSHVQKRGKEITGHNTYCVC